MIFFIFLINHIESSWKVATWLYRLWYNAIQTFIWFAI